jgi:hypothetical protein
MLVQNGREGWNGGFDIRDTEWNGVVEFEQRLDQENTGIGGLVRIRAEKGDDKRKDLAALARLQQLKRFGDFRFDWLGGIEKELGSRFEKLGISGTLHLRR